MKEPEPVAQEAHDEALLQDVGAVLRSADPPPEGVREAARELLSWRSLDAALTELWRA